MAVDMTDVKRYKTIRYHCYCQIARNSGTMRGLIFLFTLSSFCARAEMRAVDFTAPGGVRCRLTAEGSAMWRLRTARGDESFAEVGAAQALARWMGETISVTAQPIRETMVDGVRTLVSPDGSKAVLAADGSSLEFLSATGRKVLEISRIAPDMKGSVLAGRLLPKEAVYGLCERLDRLNKRGTRTLVCTRDGYNDSSASYSLMNPAFKSLSTSSPMILRFS